MKCHTGSTRGPDGLLDGAALNSEQTGLTDSKGYLAKMRQDSRLSFKIWQTSDQDNCIMPLVI